ncbi:MAG TPA: TonB-dependent receptor [Steroidobacteraceae bacterium]|nr:TonB-dependent receptor [Steroidobacteraceae bacterium]
MKCKTRVWPKAGLALGLNALLTQSVLAQSDDASAGLQLEEIVVVAQKRAENLQDVPIAITAITASQLSAGGVGNSVDMQVMTSSLSVPATAGYSMPRLRGVGTSSFGPGIENAVASYIDGVYLASAPVALFTLNNIERIEVLKGPQGTLFGRNATGGVINVITKDPQAEFGGNFDVGYGNFDTFTGSAYLTGGSERVALDLAVQGSSQGEGYGRNFATGEDANRQTSDISARSTVLFKPGDSTKIRLSFDVQSRRGDTPWLGALKGETPLFGPPTPGDEWDVNTDFDTRAKLSDAGGASLRINHQFSAAELVSITAYRRSQYDFDLDYDLTPTPAIDLQNRQKDRQFSQEFQLLSRTDDALRWVAGLYYFSAEGEWDPTRLRLIGPAINPLLPLEEIVTTSKQKTESLAAFGQATYALTASTNLTLGLRYTDEKRELDGESLGFVVGGIPIGAIASANEDESFHKMTWRIALDQQLSDDVLGYVSFNRGFKSGGFNATLLGDPPYKPELIDAYEIGVKSDLLDRRLRFNPAVFYYDYTNIQVPFFTPQGQVGIANGPSADIYGLDADFEALLAEGLHLFGGLTYLHARFGTYEDALFNIPVPTGGNLVTTADATDHELPFTSKLTATLGAEYSVPAFGGEMTLNLNAVYNDGFYTEVDNLRKQDSYPLVNAGVTWAAPGKAYYVRVWGKNLTDEAIATEIAGAVHGTAVSYQPPRTYGVTVGATF